MWAQLLFFFFGGEKPPPGGGEGGGGARGGGGGDKPGGWGGAPPRWGGDGGLCAPPPFSGPFRFNPGAFGPLSQIFKNLELYIRQKPKARFPMGALGAGTGQQKKNKTKPSKKTPAGGDSPANKKKNQGKKKTNGFFPGEGEFPFFSRGGKVTRVGAPGDQTGQTNPGPGQIFKGARGRGAVGGGFKCKRFPVFFSLGGPFDPPPKKTPRVLYGF